MALSGCTRHVGMVPSLPEGATVFDLPPSTSGRQLVLWLRCVGLSVLWLTGTLRVGTQFATLRVAWALAHARRFACGELLGKAPLSNSRAAKGSCSWLGPDSGDAPWARVERTSQSQRSPGMLPVEPLRGACDRPAPKSRLAVSVRARPKIKSEIYCNGNGG